MYENQFLSNNNTHMVASLDGFISSKDGSVRIGFQSKINMKKGTDLSEEEITAFLKELIVM
ncbi:MAG: hypothetical protein R2778_08080 [Saprospiraceae bacterium]